MKFVIFFLGFFLFLSLAQSNSLRKTHPHHHHIPHVSKFHSKSLQRIGEIVLSKLKSRTASYRFSQILPQDSDRNNEFFEEIPISSANANSTFSLNNIIHPASSAISENYGYWCSKGLHNSEEIVYWQADFLKQESFSHLLIKWAYAPGSYSIFVSSDGQNFFESLPWKECASGEANKLWRDSFWWWKWKDTSFLELVSFPERISAKSIRILMRRPQAFFFGIYSVKVLEKKTNVILKTQIGDQDFCLLKRGDNVLLRECFQQVSFSKGEEIFRLTKDYKIQKVSNKGEKKCLGFSEKTNRIIFSACGKNQTGFYNNWDFFSNEGFLGLKNGSKRCLQSHKDFYSLGRAEVNVSATSIMNDNQHNPENPFSQGPGVFWASSPGDKEVHFIVRFEEMALKQIRIKWKFKPKDFTIEVLLNGFYWKSVRSLIDNKKEEEQIDEEVDFVSGIKVLFRGTESTFNDLIVYGIEQFQIVTQYRTVRIFNCEKDGDGNEGKIWKIEDYNDRVAIVQSEFSKYEAEVNKLYRNADDNYDLVENVKKHQNQFLFLLSKNKEISVRIKKLMDSYVNIHDKLILFKDKNLMSEEKDFLKKKSITSLGSSQFKPGEDCTAIKRAFPRKRSGFYWIQPSCARFPIRVFCDFDENISKDYFFIKFDTNSSLKSHKDIQGLCASYGLAPIDITSSGDFKRLQHFLNEKSNEIGSFIPIAFDPNCEKNRCTGKFVSLASKKYFDTSLLQNDSKLQVLFTPSFAKQNDFLSSNLVPFPLSSSKVRGVICSTNNDLNDDDQNWIRIKCTDSVRENKVFWWGNPQNARFKVKCPKDCLNQKGKASIWGTDAYKDDSAVCLAAIHNNKIDNRKGGYITVGIFKSNKKKFEGSSFNGIQSLDWEEDWDRYFTIEKKEAKCPGDEEKSYIDAKTMTLMRFFEKDAIIEEGDKMEEEENKKDKLEEIFKRKKEELKYFKLIVEKSRKLLSDFQKEFILSEKNENPTVQENLLVKNAEFFQSVEKLFRDVQRLASTKLKEKIQKKDELLKEKLRLNLKYDFIEDFSGKMEEKWELSRELHSRNDSPGWSYSFSNFNGSSKLIQCTQLDEKVKISSFLILKNIKLYDGIISLSFKSQEEGLVGVAFRYRDAFNYYIFEASRSKDTSLSFKRIRKIKDGVSTDLFRSDDGGFIENVWYRLEIEFQMEKIQVTVEETEKSKIKNHVAFQVFDGDLVFGNFGLVTANVTTVMFQNVRIKSTECVDLGQRGISGQERNQAHVVYQATTCSRFKENYKSSFEMIWKSVEPVEYFDGPSSWSYSSYYNKEKVIFQNSPIKGRKIDQIPTILELKLDKFCNVGIIKAKILMRDTGYAGIAFFYQNPNNHYSLELHLSEEARFCRLRKTSKNSPILISENQNECSQFIETEQWTSVVIQLTTERILIFLGQDSLMQKVFDLKREDGQDIGRKVGLLSYGGKFGFDNFEMMPIEDYERKDQMTINENIDRRLAPECLSQTLEEREKYCKRKFEFDFDPSKMKYCAGHFCDVCCELEVLKPHKRRECNHQCQSVFLLESSDKIWRKCVDDDLENSKTYKECELGGKNQRESVDCKRDLCNLCCLKGKHVLEVENSENCQAACVFKYSRI